MRSAFLFLCAASVCFAATGEHDGSSCQRAIIVPDGTPDVMHWEMVWVRERYPDAHFYAGASLPRDNHICMMLEFDTESGKHLNLFFDVSPEKKP